MKKLTNFPGKLLAACVCLVMILASTAAAAAPTSTELPTTAGPTIGTPNNYMMEYDSSEYDEELGLILNFRLSDAGKLELLTSYCAPSYRLAEELVRLKTTNVSYNARLNTLPDFYQFATMLEELMLNGGGGPSYRTMKVSEALAVAEEIVATEEFQKFAAAAEPLAKLEATDARTLMLSFTEDELAEICHNLHETAYGEWALRLAWLDEMKFSTVLPVK